jgi:hypothetical protein
MPDLETLVKGATARSFWPEATDIAPQLNVRFLGYSARAPTSGTGCERQTDTGVRAVTSGYFDRVGREQKYERNQST